MSFRETLIRINEPRHHKIKNSYIANDYYKYYLTKKKSNISQKKFTAIFKACIDDLTERNLKQMLNVVLPYGLGYVSIQAIPVNIITNNANEKQSTMPVNWKKTMALWENDKECYEKRIVLHDYASERLRILYLKPKKKYRNMHYYMMMFSRKLKCMVYKNLAKNDNFNLNG